MAPRKVTYEQLDEICQMFETFTAGLQTALLTSVENALTIALQNLRNRLAVQSQQAIFMEINSKDDLCGEYRDPIFDIYDDDNHIQDLSNELNVQDQEAEYLKFSSEKRVQIFNKINSKDVYGHEKQNMNGVSWKEDCLGFLSYQDMVANITTKNQGKFIYPVNHPQYIPEEPPDNVYQSEEGRYKEIYVRFWFHGEFVRAKRSNCLQRNYGSCHL